MHAAGSSTPPSGLTRREWRERMAVETPRATSRRDVRPTLQGTPTILTVCTGNICRSPLAEALLRARFTDSTIRVRSAGTHALVGHPMTEQAQCLALTYGASPADTTTHAARYLRDPLMTESDLILGMTREHRRQAVQMVPRRLHQVFTLREFARLASGLSSDDVRTAADAAGSSPRARLAAAVIAVSRRRNVASAPSEDDDVVDPYGEADAVYEESARQLVPALDEVERVVLAALG